jgi:hypothetical protein
MVFSSL